MNNLANKSGLSVLGSRYPWPEARPNLPFNPGGWFPQCNKESLQKHLSPKTELVVELGSWLGLSTRWIMDQAPNAWLIAIDNWQGGKEIKDDPILPVVYDTFVSNCWAYKDRLVQMRTTTEAGLDELLGLGVKPDLVYLDAGHDYESVQQDINACIKFGCTLIGDDFNPNAWPGVVQAVWENSLGIGQLAVHGSCWTIPGVK